PRRAVRCRLRLDDAGARMLDAGLRGRAQSHARREDVHGAPRRPGRARRSARDLQARIALAPVLPPADRARAARSAEPGAAPGRGAPALTPRPRSALARAAWRQ